MRPKVYVSRGAFETAIDLLRRNTEVEVCPENRILSKDELLTKLSEVDGVLTQITETMSREVLEAAGRLKVISNVAVGFDNIDVAAANELNIVVTNTPGVLTETTADFAWTLMMAAARRVTEANEFVRSGKFKVWDPKRLLGHDMYGKVLGLIGCGRIGQAVARRATGFNMKILGCSAHGVPENITRELHIESVTVEELLRRSDFVSLHIPLKPETRHLLDDTRFSLMKPNCILVNTSRGAVIDEKALVRALKSARVAAVGLDVFEHEPAIEPELLTMDNVVLTPHIGASSYETRLSMSMMAAQNLLSVLQGKRPEHLVNPMVWERRRT